MRLGCYLDSGDFRWNHVGGPSRSKTGRKKTSMFHRHRIDVSASSTVPTPMRSVRLLQGEDELQAAVERARAFERRGVDERQRRMGTYDRFLNDGNGTPATPGNG